MFFVACLGLIIWKLDQSKRKTSTILIYTLKLFSFYILLLKTIAPIPLFQAFVTTLYCEEDDPYHEELECYSGSHLIHVIVASVGIAIAFIYGLMTSLFCIDINPASTLPYAAPLSKMGVLKFFGKLILVIYITIDYKVELIFLEK